MFASPVQLPPAVVGSDAPISPTLFLAADMPKTAYRTFVGAATMTPCGSFAREMPIGGRLFAETSDQHIRIAFFDHHSCHSFGLLMNSKFAGLVVTQVFNSSSQ
jgi:hypothetical protein